MKEFDLFVIGGGSGGIRAARLGGNLGLKVGLAEQDRLGGTCVIRGCIPKKLMVYAADFADSFNDSAGFGWSVEGTGFDLARFRQAKDAEIGRLEGVYRRNAAGAGVEIYDARARLEDAETIGLDTGEFVRARHVLVATGGVPFVPCFPGAEFVSTSDDIFELDDLPSRVLISGGGYIACEFAGILNGMGSKVTQYYRGDQILRGFDNSLREEVGAAMCKRGIDIRFGMTVENISRKDGSLGVTGSDGQVADYDLVLFATGRRPNTAGLGLEKAGVRLDKAGAVVVDDYSRTDASSIYAVGDATNRLNLTPVAIREAVAFIETVFKNNPTRPAHTNVPTAVFTRPELGTVGLSEEEAGASGSIAVYESRFRPLTNTLAGRDEYNYMKLVADRSTDRVLGVHIIGPGAAEMIQLAGVAMGMGATKSDFDRTVAVHPTAAEELVTLGDPARVT